jgi:hypothetical protein
MIETVVENFVLVAVAAAAASAAEAVTLAMLEMAFESSGDAAAV